MKGTVVAVCLSEQKGTTKHEVPEGRLKTDYGLEGDAHAGNWHRQVSLLAEESIEKMRQDGLDLGYGDFAENITTRGLVLYELPVGTQLRIGDEALLEITQIGKDCHHGCAIAQKVGHCVMPREGIFARVLRGGRVRPGDEITVLSPGSAMPKPMASGGQKAMIRVAILTVSDKGAAGQREDRSGPVLAEIAEAMNWEKVYYRIVPDEISQIKDAIIDICDNGIADLMLTTGGTGFAPRDVTPEATLAVMDKEAPGLAELMRSRTLAVTPKAALSRARAGIRKSTLIVNLPGSPKAAKECLEAIIDVIPHAIDILKGNVTEHSVTGHGK